MALFSVSRKSEDSVEVIEPSLSLSMAENSELMSSVDMLDAEALDENSSRLTDAEPSVSVAAKTSSLLGGCMPPDISWVMNCMVWRCSSSLVSNASCSSLETEPFELASMALNSFSARSALLLSVAPPGAPDFNSSSEMAPLESLSMELKLGGWKLRMNCAPLPTPLIDINDLLSAVDRPVTRAASLVKQLLRLLQCSRRPVAQCCARRVSNVSSQKSSDVLIPSRGRAVGSRH